MTPVKDMSTTTKPLKHKGYQEDDQENDAYADRAVMPRVVVRSDVVPGGARAVTDSLGIVSRS